MSFCVENRETAYSILKKKKRITNPGAILNDDGELMLFFQNFSLCSFYFRGPNCMIVISVI